MSIQSNQLYNEIAQAGQTNEKSVRMATVTSITGGVFIRFFGEDTASQKPFKRLSSYTARVNDVVLVQKINGSYVITGKVT